MWASPSRNLVAKEGVGEAPTQKEDKVEERPVPSVFLEDGCVYGMHGADRTGPCADGTGAWVVVGSGADVGGGARPGGRGVSSPLRDRWWGAPQGVSVLS